MAGPDLYTAAGQQYNIDPVLLQAIARVESGARDNGPDSSAGAGGRMGFMPRTAVEYGITNRADPTQSVPAAARKLNDLLNQHGADPVKALMGYNGGDPSRWNNPETQAYPGKVAVEYQRLKAAQGKASQSMASGPPVHQMSDDALDNLITGGNPSAAPADAAPRSWSDEELDRLIAPAGVSGMSEKQMAAAQANGNVDPRNGQPVQFMSNMDPKSPVGQAMPSGGRMAIAEGQLPGPMTQAAIGLATNREQQRRIAAAQLFPDLSPAEAQSRVFYGDDNRLAAVGSNGKPFYVDPAPANANLMDTNVGAPSLLRANPQGFTPGNLLARAAGTAGPALPVVGSVVGGAVGGPADLVVGPFAAGAGAAMGDQARQYLARGLDPAAVPVPIDYTQTALEGAMGAGGQLLGGLANRAMAPNALRVSAADATAIQRDPTILSTARAAYDRASAQGVPLTAGQATGLPSLLGREDVAHTTLPYTADMTRQFYRNQGNALTDASQNMLDKISPASDKTDAALMFQQGASDAATYARQSANEAAKPYYDAAAATKMPPGMSRLNDILGTPDGRSAYAAAVNSAANDGIRLPSLPHDIQGIQVPFEGWDYMKKVLQGRASEAARSGDNYRATQMTDLANAIKNEVIKVNPAYAQALETVAPGQRLAARLQDSFVGKVGAGGGDEKARAIVAPVFEQSNPRAIVEARQAFESAGRSDEWNAGVRSYIQDAFDKASMSQQGLNPASLRRQVWGNVDNRAAIRAALSPAQYDGFDRFMTTVEDAARTYPTNSLTEPRRNALAGMQAEAEGDPAVRTIRGAFGLLSVPRLADVAGRAGDRLTGGMVQRNMRDMVTNLFSPDGMRYLEQMAQYSPRSQQATSLTAQFLTQMGAGQGPRIRVGLRPNTPGDSGESSNGQSSASPVNRLLRATP